MRSKIAVLLITLILASCTPTETTPPTPTTPPLASEITVYGWPDDVAPEVLNAFTAQYGVAVNYVGYADQDAAAGDIRAGGVYDVVVMSNELVATLGSEGLLAEIDYTVVPNFRNISPNFRDLAYDPQNRYSVPYNWGTNGIIVRSDLLAQPITRWADVWNLEDDQRIVMWPLPRYGVGAALKSLGYSVNSQDETQLEEARVKLLELRPHVIFLGAEDYSVAPYLLDGSAVVGMNAGVNEAIEGQVENSAVEYVLPEDGAILWGDNFVVPASSTNQYTAFVFLNFLLTPENGALLASWNQYASPNEAARSLLDSSMLENEQLYPSSEQLANAEILLPLSDEVYQRYLEIWNEFVAAGE